MTDAPITSLSSLDITPKDGDPNLGFYLPRMTLAERNAIPTRILRAGCMIHLMPDNVAQEYDGTTWRTLSRTGDIEIHAESLTFTLANITVDSNVLFTVNNSGPTANQVFATINGNLFTGAPSNGTTATITATIPEGYRPAADVTANNSVIILDNGAFPTTAAQVVANVGIVASTGVLTITRTGNFSAAANNGFLTFSMSWTRA